MGTLRDLRRQLDEAARRQGQVLPTENIAWGFWGTMESALPSHLDRPPIIDIWTLTFKTIMKWMPDLPSRAIREFLDSKWGRHFADAVVDDLSPGHLEGKPITVAMVGKAVGAALQRDGKWVRDEIAKFAGMETTAEQAGTTGGLALIMKALDAAWAEMQAQEARKNWKEREAAMHEVMKQADFLVTSARAWFAQKR